MASELPVKDDPTADSLAIVTVDTTTMEVNGVSPVVVDEVGQTETEPAVEGEKAEELEGDWEMVAIGHDDISTREEDPTPPKPQQEQQEPEKKDTTEVTAVDGLDEKKLMDMVATLCERSTHQCALIGALAKRVDTLERSVRWVKEADQRRQKNQKMNKEAKKGTRSFYSDKMIL
ncbi:hypothetical protein ZWY2020_023810 [Hordeum vulgare]|nr:hypothetical protein ZWY2020_023810 [Hordeum vulgare]